MILLSVHFAHQGPNIEQPVPEYARLHQAAAHRLMSENK